ncbi:HNH endonuclease [Mycoplasma sp. 4423]
MIKVSKLLDQNIHPFLYGMLMSRILISKDNKYFAAVSSYQESKKVNSSKQEFLMYSNQYLQFIKNLDTRYNWIDYHEYTQNYKYTNFSFNGKEKAILLIQNDLDLTENNFFNRLYAKIFQTSDFNESESITEPKKWFIRGFFESRGSIDTSLNFLSIDLFYNSKFQLNKIKLLTDVFNIPISVLNINFRQLQKQFVENINRRNTQLRINLKWYINQIRIINNYKFKIILSNYSFGKAIKIDELNFIECQLSYQNKPNKLNSVIDFFISLVLDKDLSSYDVKKLRNQLFKTEWLDIKVNRNRQLVSYVLLNTSDVCYGCINRYPLEHRTFMHRKTSRNYFEIHHNISLSNNQMLDNIDNLVKLCPVCHSCLKKMSELS